MGTINPSYNQNLLESQYVNVAKVKYRCKPSHNDHAIKPKKSSNNLPLFDASQDPPLVDYYLIAEPPLMVSKVPSKDPIPPSYDKLSPTKSSSHLDMFSIVPPQYR